MMTDRDLILRSMLGENQAFEELVVEYQSKVYTLCFRYMGNEEDAYDMAQETFIKAFRSLPSFQGKSRFGTWLYRVATNICLDEIRRRKRRVSTVSMHQQLETEDSEMEKEIADVRPTVEALYEQKELSLYIQTVLDQMKPEHRTVIILRDMMGLSYEEIGEVLNCSTGTVKSRLSRARTIFRNNFIKREHLP
ncbi:rna polymerase sigma factor rpoe [hydrocarbon metagenome]|uniref:Rna polymerase sigma factor rpoe n=1 Tax=hydrocarbon metagenome TaxID=938273 RepID=A0A0W8E5H5_9ZZZZ